MAQNSTRKFFKVMVIAGVAVTLLATTSCSFVSAKEYPMSTPTPTYSSESNDSSNDGGVDVVIIDPSKPSSTSSSSSDSTDTEEQKVSFAYQELLDSMYNIDDIQYEAYKTIEATYPVLEPEEIPMANALLLQAFPWLEIVNTKDVSDLDINTAYATLATQAVNEYETKTAGDELYTLITWDAVTIESDTQASIDPALVQVLNGGQNATAPSLGKENTVNFVKQGNEWYLVFDGTL